MLNNIYIGAGVPLHIVRNVIDAYDIGLHINGCIDAVYRGQYNQLTIIVPVYVQYDDGCYSVELRSEIRFV